MKYKAQSTSKRKIFSSFFLLPSFFFLLSSNISFGDQIGTIDISGVINPITSRFIKNSINRAEKEGFSLLVMKVDTPGGLVTSTHEIVKHLLNAKIPICVYIYPKGSRAASAGVFICLASDIIAMAPSTHIGAAHPVVMGGNIPEKTEEKILNDLVAQIKGIAKERNRNVEWAEKAVRESKSITEEEAIRLNICDIIANDMDELIKKLDGWSIKRDERVITLRTNGKKMQEIKMSFREKFLHSLAEPNIAYIFLILGIYGLIYEFASPGIGLGAVLGFIFLLLAFFGLSNLSINLAGLLLIILGFILLIAEIKAQTHGILTIGGSISLLLGSFMLIDQGVSPELAISKSLIFSIVGATVLLFLILISLGLKAQFRKVQTGSKGMIGIRGIAKKDGLVFVDGELWKARGDREINEGDEIEVIGIDRLLLRVKRKE